MTLIQSPFCDVIEIEYSPHSLQTIVHESYDGSIENLHKALESANIHCSYSSLYNVYKKTFAPECICSPTWKSIANYLLVSVPDLLIDSLHSVALSDSNGYKVLAKALNLQMRGTRSLRPYMLSIGLEAKDYVLLTHILRNVLPVETCLRAAFRIFSAVAVGTNLQFTDVFHYNYADSLDEHCVTNQMQAITLKAVVFDEPDYEVLEAFVEFRSLLQQLFGFDRTILIHRLHGMKLHDVAMLYNTSKENIRLLQKSILERLEQILPSKQYNCIRDFLLR